MLARLVRRLLSFSLTALASLPLLAHDRAERYGESWRWVRFGEEEGLPRAAILALEESPDGIVWVGTSEGLVRYDGWQWHPVAEDQGLPREIVHSLCIGPRGEVWAALPSGVYRGGMEGFARLDVLAEHGITSVVSLALAEDGDLFVVSELEAGNARRLHRIIDLETTPRVLLEPLLGASDIALYRPRSGRLWVSTEKGAFVREGETWSLRLAERLGRRVVSALDENANLEGILGIRQSNPEQGLWSWSGDDPPRSAVSEAGGVLQAASVSPSGDAFAVYDSGEVRLRIDGTWRSVASVSPVIPGLTLARYRDNGDLWLAGSQRLYLLRLSSERWTRWHHDELFSPSDRVNALAFDAQGNLLVASPGGVERRAPDGTLLPLPPAPDDVPQDFTGFAVDRAGGIWGSHGGWIQGLVHGDGTTWRRILTDSAGGELGLIHRIATDRDGGLWFLALAAAVEDSRAEAGAVHRLVDGRVVPWEHSGALAGTRVYDFQETPDGARWFATSRGIRRLREGRWTSWAADEGLRQPVVFRLCPDPAGGMWFGQPRKGLGRIEADDVVSYVDLGTAPGVNEIWDLVAGEQGELWLTTRAGFHRLQGDVLADFGDFSGFPFPRLWPVVQRDGKVYVGSLGRGVHVFDPAELAEEDPRVRGVAVLRSGANSLLRWSVVSRWGTTGRDLIESRLRLDDGDWSAWSGLHERDLADLPSGRHGFEIQARGPLGNLSDQVARGELTIPRPWWRESTFLIPVGLLCVLGIAAWALVNRRRQRHAATLRRREAVYRQLMEQASDAIFVVDRDGRCRLANRRAAELTGYAVEELIGRALTTLLVETNEGNGAPSASRVDEVFVQEFEIVHRSGERLAVEVSGNRLDEGRLQLIARDLTARRRVEQQRLAFERELTEIQKQESLGELARGVAHDFNNLLTVILGNTDQVMAQVGESSGERKRLEKVVVAAMKAGELTQQLLAYAGRGSIRPRSLDLNDIVQEVGDLLRTSTGPRIKIRTLLTAGLPAVRADAERLRQVILNLAANASDAVGEGPGEILLRTRAVQARDLGSSPGEHDVFAPETEVVVAEVKDDGSGMDERTRARIFEPFFSTKFQGRGLGLAAVQGIVRRHRGIIMVESASGVGSTFSVVLPAAAVEAEAPAPESGTVSRAVGQTVLVIDDEEAVCEITAAMLGSLGFHALTAFGGREGVEVFRRHADEIACSVIDLTMPGFDGVQTRNAIRRIDPDAPVLLVSGFQREGLTTEVPPGQHDFFLQKPFSAEVLRATVRSLFDGSDREETDPEREPVMSGSLADFMHGLRR